MLVSTYLFYQVNLHGSKFIVFGALRSFFILLVALSKLKSDVFMVAMAIDPAAHPQLRNF